MMYVGVRAWSHAVQTLPLICRPAWCRLGSVCERAWRSLLATAVRAEAERSASASSSYMVGQRNG